MIFWALLASRQIVMRSRRLPKPLGEALRSGLLTSPRDPIISNRGSSPQADFYTHCERHPRASGHALGCPLGYLASELEETASAIRASVSGSGGTVAAEWRSTAIASRLRRRAINRFANHRADGAESLFCVASKYSRSNPSSAVRVAGSKGRSYLVPFGNRI
jgi:hypothetical protein